MSEQEHQLGRTQPATLARQWRLFFMAAALGWIALILIGSWYPFRFTSFEFTVAVQSWWSAHWSNVPKTDLTVNFLVGWPLGFAGWMAISPVRPRWSSRILATIGVLFVLASVGFLVEIVQAGLPSRNPSWTDTASQILGGGLGMMVAAAVQNLLLTRIAAISDPSSDSRIDDDAGRNPENEPKDRRLLQIRAALEIYLAVYAIWMLLPFVPAISPSDLSEKWRSGAIQLSPIEPWLTSPWDAAYTALAASLTTIPIGVWFAIRMRATDGRGNAVTAMLSASLTVIGLEMCQLIIQSRTVATADMLWSAIGAMAGVGIFMKYGRLMIPAATPVQNRLKTRPDFQLWFLLTIAYVLLYLLLATAPFEWVGSKAELMARIERLKLDGWRNQLSGNDLGLLTNSLRTVLWSLPLGGLSAMTWLRCRPTLRWWVALMMVLGVMGVCCLSEGMQLFLADRNCTLVGALIRVAGSLAGMTLVTGLMTSKRVLSRAPENGRP